MARKKEIDYYDFFTEAIDYVCTISKKLLLLAEDYKRGKVGLNIESRIDEIHKLEHEADLVYHKVVFELNRAFMTPLERDDILAVAHAIDNISDSIEEVAFRFWMFNITELRPETHAFVELIVKCCDKAKSAVDEFRHFKKSKTIGALIDDLGKLENEGDLLYRKAIRELFLTEKNPLEVQKWREILHDMEKCFDMCKFLGTSIENAIVKNS